MHCTNIDEVRARYLSVAALTRKWLAFGLAAVAASGCSSEGTSEASGRLGEIEQRITTISPYRNKPGPALTPISFSGTRVRSIMVKLNPDGTSGRAYVGGSFSFTVNGVTYNNLAAFDVTSAYQVPPALVPGFHPEPNDTVWAMVVEGSKLYVGGEFTRLGNTSRSRLAVVDTSTGVVDGTFLPSVSGDMACGAPCQSSPPSSGDPGVHALAFTPDGSSLIVGGNFTSPRSDPAGGSTGMWGVWAINAVGSKLLVGGDVNQWGARSPTKFFTYFEVAP